ncbi:putative P450 monooxygenase [Hortaea werneckii]|nr:putative P450 monooxygenase [Hortaea werneckii]KAI7402705.1 putative P450 monooxygenase [Hortaea werneckii]
MLAFTLLFSVALASAYLIVYNLFVNPLSKVPGPKLFALTKWRLAWEDYRGQRTRTIHSLHERFGPAVRIGPNDVHFNSFAALKKIYGAGSGFERTSFYRMFDAYGRQNLFTFADTKRHGDRKKLLANAYSKSSIVHGAAAQHLDRLVRDYLDLLRTLDGRPNDAFETLHYFSIDAITNFLYGSNMGGTTAMKGNKGHRALLDDIHDPSRRTLTWFGVHLPLLTKWLYSRAGLVEILTRPLLPMKRPTTYTGIRAHALQAMKTACASTKSDGTLSSETSDTIIEKLLKHRAGDGRNLEMDDLDVASECADHLLAGIDTTADTLMFLFWALSLPEHQNLQAKLIEEVKLAAIDLTEAESLSLAAADRLPYLSAVIKETLRLYAPLPASEPRCMPYADTVIEGYAIPAGTVVSCSPYSLHRNPEVFPEPLKFMPQRWLGERNAEAERWFWAFSSGGRMCIGIHLAMAEMTSLVAAVYQRYTTSLAPGFEHTSPAITSRVELFYDETQPKVAEHKCLLCFKKQT